MDVRYFSNGADVKSGSRLLTDFERSFTCKLLSVLPEDTCLVNTTWLGDEITLDKLSKWETDKRRANLLLYSGMDWENTTNALRRAKRVTIIYTIDLIAHILVTFLMVTTLVFG